MKLIKFTFEKLKGFACAALMFWVMAGFLFQFAGLFIMTPILLLMLYTDGNIDGLIALAVFLAPSWIVAAGFGILELRNACKKLRTSYMNFE